MKKIALLILCFICLISMSSCDSVLDFLLTELSGSTQEQSPSESYEMGAQPESESRAESESAIQSESESQSKSESQRESSEGQSESSVVILPGHEHSFSEIVVASGCVEKGYTRHSCPCGYYYLDTFTSARGSHSFVRGVCTECEEIDYAELINIISTETIKANVTVKAKYSSVKGFFESTVGVSNGSGVIIKHENGVYYALTNNHVVYSESLTSSSTNTSYYVIDYIGTEYQATLVARLAEYDLAIVKFSSTESYTVLSLEEGNSQAGDLVISLGQPEGQSNTITLGNTAGYGRVTLKDAEASESNVTFNVLEHDAYINSGSSGGALLDADLNVIGINYAGAIDEDGNSVASYAIPVEKVYEFFDAVGFIYKNA